MYQDGTLTANYSLAVTSDDLAYNNLEGASYDSISGDASGLTVTFPSKGVTNPQYLGTAEIPSFATGGSALVPIGAGDFNGDGRDDPVVIEIAGSEASFVVELSQSNGSFERLVIVSNPDIGDHLLGQVMTPWASFLVADFNNDGKADFSFFDDAGDWHFYLSTGTSFTESDTLSWGEFGGTNTMVAGDFNGDGKLDVARRTTGDLLVNLGNGDGTFADDAISSSIDSYVLGLTAGDLNHDGKADIVVSGINEGSSNVLLSDGDGTFTQGQVFSSLASYHSAIGDLNGDNYPDLVFVGVENVLDSYNIHVYLGNGDGTFQTSIDYQTDVAHWLVWLTDLNADGALDIINTGLSSPNLSVWLNNGAGAFTKRAYYNQFGLNSFVADFNADGKPDVLGGFYGIPGNPATLTIFYGSYTPPVTTVSRPTRSSGQSLSSSQLKQMGIIANPSSLPTSSCSSNQVVIPVLRPGTKGEFVELVQAKLIKLKLLKIKTPNGTFGLATKIAVKQLQKKYKLPQTGMVDLATAKVLQGVKL